MLLFLLPPPVWGVYRVDAANFIAVFPFRKVILRSLTTLPPSSLNPLKFCPLLSRRRDAERETFPFFFFISHFSAAKLNSNMSPPSRRLQTKPVITCLKTFLISYSLIFWVSRWMSNGRGEGGNEGATKGLQTASVPPRAATESF